MMDDVIHSIMTRKLSLTEPTTETVSSKLVYIHATMSTLVRLTDRSDYILLVLQQFGWHHQSF